MSGASCEAARNDADLVHGLHGILKDTGEYMPDLMISGKTFILLGDHSAFLFFAQGKLILGFFKIRHLYARFIFTGCDQSSFIYQICQVRTAETGSTPGNQLQKHIVGQRYFGGVYFQNLRPAFDIRKINRHLAVKPAGTQQSRIQNVGTVCCGNDDHRFVGFKAVHLHQKLIQGLFPFIVSTAQSGTAMPAYRVYLVNKSDAGRILFGCFKEVTNSRRAHSHKHFHKIRARDGEKGHPCFSGYSLCQ